MATGSRVPSAWGAHSLLLPSPPSLCCTRKAAFPGRTLVPGQAGPPGHRSPPSSLPTCPQSLQLRGWGARAAPSPSVAPGPVGSCQATAPLLCSWTRGCDFGRCGGAWLSRTSTPCCPQNPAHKQPLSQPGPIQSLQLRLENRNPFGKGLALGTKSPSWHRAGREPLGTARWQQHSLRSATRGRLSSAPGPSVTYSGSCVRSAPRSQHPGPAPCSRPRSMRRRSRRPSLLPLRL